MSPQRLKAQTKLKLKGAADERERLGQAGQVQSLGEAELRMHLHDAKFAHHDKDFHVLVVA